MSDKVIAISSEVVECGKRVSDSKKKFVWRFRIGEKTYNLQLVSSALSGKRSITLNDQPIYSEQNVLNIKFDFNHNIDGHSLRIFRQLQSVHAYDLRIDNRSFEYLLKKKDNPTTTETKVTGKYEAQESDPFSDFDKIASSSGNNNTNNNFGDFDDFSNFQFTKQQKTSSNNEKKVEQKKGGDFDFDFNEKKQTGIRPQNFETNNFNNNISNLETNMKNLDLLSADNFTTNNYGNYSNYLDLIDATNGGGTSDTWGMETEPKKKTILQQMKPDISGKQMINKTLMTAVQIKKKAVNQFESLI